jgi:hypothetical protein
MITPSDPEAELVAPSADGAAEPPRHSARRKILLVVGAIVVVLVLLGLWVVFGGEKAQQSSEEQARQRIEAGSSAPTSPTTPSGESRLTTSPTAGFYRYQGSGKENTTFPPLTEDQGPGMPATVTAEPDGCWVVRIDFNTHHWQDWTYCTANGQLSERRGSTFARRNYGGMDIDNTSTFTCDPPALILDAADQPGAARPRLCVGSGTLIPAQTTVAGTMTVVGREQIDVGGQSVPTVHVRYDLTYSGAQSGSEKTDDWFAETTGMPVRNEHHITVGTDTPFGMITYTEDAQFVLQTAQPV